MAQATNIPFDRLTEAHLVIDTVYMGGQGNLEEPIHYLFPKCGNMGGFRKVRRNDNSGKLAYVILYTTMSELEWPDYLDVETGVFRYYGDNRKPGHNITDTHNKGNALLEEVFGRLSNAEDRNDIPPFFILANPHSECNRILRGSRPGTTYDDACGDMHHWRHHGRLQPS